MLDKECNAYSFFDDKQLQKSRVDFFYNLFLKTRREYKIALYYYIRAAMLARADFIEEAGINLQLSIEAIIEDYKLFNNVCDTKTDAEQMQNNIVGSVQYLSHF